MKKPRELHMVHNSPLKKKLITDKSIHFFVSICWLAYFSTYLGRLNYSASMNDLVHSGFITKPQAGMIGTGFFFCYGTGQLISGFLGDRISPRIMGFVGIASSSIINLCVYFAKDGTAVMILWGLNGLAQSLIWSPIIKILSDRLSRESCKKACISMSTTVAVGTLSAYLMSAVIIALIGWRYVFFASFLIVGIISIVWLIAIGKVEKEADAYGILDEEKDSNSQKTTDVSRKSTWKVFVAAGLIPISICIIIQGILKDGVTAWVPTYISEIFRLGSVTSILTTIILPIINLSGVYVANYVNYRYFRNEVKTSGACFAVASISLVLLVLIGKFNVILAALLLAFTTTGMIGVNTMFISLIPLYFSKMGKVSTITGILNSLAYAGSAISSYGIGYLAEKYGWNITIALWLVLAIVGVFVCIAVKGVWEHYTKNS
ncbi:MAG: major facilitator superfamily 1 [Herbinix sp.]|jgi:OPA family glycerol-3-phosphate transporter-like MFS transporter|nr:major facilitator superfamily 1 [Herbinix sp.]